MKINKHKLASKGWSNKEIEHASRIISEAENKKHKIVKIIDTSIYWLLLVLLILCNALISSLLIPFIFVIKGSFIIFIVTFIGFAFGMFFSILIADINRHETRYNGSLVTSLAVSGMINFIMMSQLSQRFSTTTNLPLMHSPYLIAGIYLFAYLVPHIVLMISENQKQ